MALAGRDRAVMPCITSAKRLAGGNARNAGARNADAIATGLGRVSPGSPPGDERSPPRPALEKNVARRTPGAAVANPASAASANRYAPPTPASNKRAAANEETPACDASNVQSAAA